MKVRIEGGLVREASKLIEGTEFVGVVRYSQAEARDAAKALVGVIKGHYDPPIFDAVRTVAVPTLGCAA